MRRRNRHLFEEGGACNCTIRSSLFDNCLFGVWGKAVIIAPPHVDEKYRAVSRYSRNILIENNTFRISDGSGLLSAHGVDGLIWRKNIVQKTTDYPARTTAAKQFDVSDCDHVSIE